MHLINKILIRATLLLIFAFLARSNAQEFKVISGSGETGNNSDIIDYDVPYTLTPGQEYTVTVTIVNTGQNTWSKNENYHLEVYDQSDNNFISGTWGLSRVELTRDVLPSDKVNLSFKIKAPETSGVYYFKWAMAKDKIFFGEYTNNVIKVGGDNIPQVSEYNGESAEFINVNLPPTMNAGEKYKVILTMKNNGSTKWPSSSSDEYKIEPVVESSDLTYPDWNSEPVFLSSAVDPGQTSDIEFYITAPFKPGAYELQWIMKKGNNYFGEKSNRYTINVIGKSNSIIDPKTYNASFIAQTVPITMVFNQVQKISITISNTGTKTWVSGREQLVLIDARDEAVSINLWNTGYIQLPHNVEPGDLVSFNFEVKPTKTGWQYFQCRMMREDGTLFGSPTQSVEVLVSEIK